MVEYVKYEEEVHKLRKRRNSIVQINSYVLILIIINLVFFIAQYVIPGFQDFLILDTNNAFERPWTLLTTMFLHANFTHILFNMYALLLFGSMLERKIGAKKFIVSYLMIGLIVSFAAVFIYPGKVLGASGAVMGVIGMLIMIMPNLQLLFFFVVPIRLWVAGIVWFILDLFGAFSPTSGVANLAHIIGMLLGLAYGYYLINRNQRKTIKFSLR